MMKTIEQLNQEFLNEFATDKTVSKSVETTDNPDKTVSISTKLSDNIVDIADIRKETAKVQGESVSKRTVSSSGKNKSTRYKTPLWKDLLFLIIKIVLILLAFVAMFTFLFGFVRYGEPSMTPSIKDGDLLIYHRYTKVGYMIRDAIILEHDGQIQARRVVATAGDVVDITESGLVINGSVQQETDIYQDTERYMDGVAFPLTVPDGFVFVLGDSRTGATDSRIYGPVDIDDTLGKVMAVIRRRSI